MRSAVAPLLTVALVVTGILLALDVAMQIASDSLIPASERNAASPYSATVLAFYDAANETLAGSGDGWPQGGASAQGEDNVLAHLKALSRQGVTRLKIEEIVDDGRKVSVLVAGYQTQHAIGLGADKRAPIWRTIDTLSVAEGAVVAYEPGPIPPPDRPSMPTVTFAALPGDMDVSLARIELAPDAAVSSFMAPYPHLIMVESGILTVSSRHSMPLARSGDATFTRWDPDRNDPDISLGPGDAMTLPEGASATLRNDGLAPVSVYNLLIAPHAALAPSHAEEMNDAFTVLAMHDPQGIGQPIARSAGVSTTALAVASLASARERARSIQVESHRALLEPGERIPPVPADRVTMVAVISGTVSVSSLAEGPSATVKSDASPTGLVVRGGEAVVVNPGSVPRIDNAGASVAELLLFEIGVVTDPASPSPR